METIKEQFNKVLAYSQLGVGEPQTEKIFAAWEESKSNFIEAFGDKLIYEVPGKISFELDEISKDARIENFISSMWNQGYPELGRFLECQKDGFYKNSVVEEYKVPDEKGTIITKNSKLVKAFKYFITNKSELNDLQSKASQLIQENRVEGTLCFSVHPLDYLSISENTYNWRSCHALDGEYRAGNLSYMMDSSTIVCYLKGDKDAQLPNFPEDVVWNNKKWRVLLYFSNDWRMVFAGKQYPFATSTGMNIVLNWLNERFVNGLSDSWYTLPATGSYWSDWTDFTVSTLEASNIRFNFNDDLIPVENGLVSLYKLVKNKPGSKHFNDVLHSSCYKPIYTYLVHKERWSEKAACYANLNTHFEIGGMTTCLRCGNAEIMQSSSTMMCYDCELKYGTAENDSFCFCSHCNTRILVEDANYVNDEPMCDDCYFHIAQRCDMCGDSYLKEELYYNEVTDEYLCSWCQNNR